MNQVARIFFPAVLAAMVVGTAPSGAADDPVATAPIPPPLPAEPLSPATPMMIPATTPPKPKTELPGPTAAAPLKKPETAAAPKQKTAPQCLGNIASISNHDKATAKLKSVTRCTMAIR